MRRIPRVFYIAGEQLVEARTPPPGASHEVRVDAGRRGWLVVTITDIHTRSVVAVLKFHPSRGWKPLGEGGLVALLPSLKEIIERRAGRVV